MDGTATIIKNEYGCMEMVAKGDNITISRSEYDYLKNRENILAIVCIFLDNKEFCEDELRMILGIERRENETSDCDSERVESSKEQI